MQTPEKKRHPVLIVDDEANVRHAIARLLCRAKISVLFADCGQAGINQLRENKVAAVISDYHMPLMNGADFLQHAMAIQPEAVRIVITGRPEPATVQDAINQGRAGYFFAKPWDDSALLEVVESALAADRAA